MDTNQNTAPQSPETDESLATPPPIPDNPPSAPVQAVAPDVSISKEFKGCLYWIGGIIAVLIVLATLINWWREILIVALFFGIWLLVAKRARKDGKSQKFALGAGLILAFFVSLGTFAIIESSDDDEKSDVAESSSQLQLSIDAWREIPLENRRELVESKYLEVKEYSKELDELLLELNSGNTNPNIIGRVQIWKTNVPYLIEEVESLGWKPGVSSNYNAMAEAHSTLISMMTAWETYEQALGATTPEDMRTYSLMHSTSLKYVKENLRDCGEYIEEGEY